MAKESPGLSEVDEVEIDPARLCPGVFVRLKLGWMDHPFMFNQFRITSAAQVEQIRALGLAKVCYVPSRSVAKPLDAAAARAQPVPAAAAVPTGVPAPAVDAVQPRLSPQDGAAPPALNSAATTTSASDSMPASTSQPTPATTVSAPAPSSTEPMPVRDEPGAGKAQQARRIAAVRQRISRCERGYTEAAAQVRNVMQGIHAAPERAIGGARAVVTKMVEGFTADGEMVIHLMNEKLADETAYFHVLNVMVLSLLLGRELRLPPELLKVLGEGALFHDLGKLRVPDTVLRNPHRNRHEEEFYRLHTVYGAEMAREMGVMPAPVREIIELHHETADGKGFPRGLAGDKIPLLARIVGIANRYDNLCNPLSRADSITPAEALARMFREEASMWDLRMLQQFVRMLGVYPPGSLVQLSNGNVGLVVSVNHADLLRPSVMVFDPAVPKNDALVIDLTEEPEVQIDIAIKARELEPAALDYLSPRRRMSYFGSNQQKQ